MRLVLRSAMRSRCVFILAAAALVLAGCSGGNSGTGTCTGNCPTTVPAVSSTTPVSTATGIAVNSTVSATFDMPMTASSLTTTTFTLASAAGPVTGTVALSSSTETATFTPSSALANGTQYTATITTGVTSAAGGALTANYTWTFTTVAAASAPSVLSTSPTTGATAVSASTDVSATFSTPMTASTLTTTTFTLASTAGPVAGTVSYASGSDAATFTPSAPLADNTSYTATITTGAQSSGGVPLDASYSWSFTTAAVVSSTATIDYGTQDQIIRGFGGSTAWLGQLTSAQANALFSPTTGLGLSILRVRIDPSGSATSTPAWATSNWGQELENGLEAQTANPNAEVIATPWTPPVSMKTSGPNEEYNSGCSTATPDLCGGYLAPSHYADYANYLEDFVTYFKNGGVNLYGISMQNEPDANVAYESCFWAPTTDNNSSAAGSTMDTWIANNASVLTTKLIMPESESFNPNFASDSLNDPNAASHISIIGGHIYGVSPSYYTQAEKAGKEVWMTEHYLTPAVSGAQPTITDALAAATEIHNSMVTAQYNAYVWWWIWNNPADSINYGLIDSNTTTPTPTYYGDAIGQFSKFIQPGYYRYNATANPVSGVYVSAYSGNSGGTTHYVIVAINNSSNPVSQSFTISNATVSSMTPWQTTASSALAQQSAISVSGGAFTYTLPAQSITTFVQ